MSKPTGIIDYLLPWFIPLFCFLVFYFFCVIVQVKIAKSILQQVLSVQIK